MSKQSAGLLMFREGERGTEVFLVHPGGPFWKNKDMGAWTVPKGERQLGEEFLATAIREFQEETGFVPVPPYFPLGSLKQRSGKEVHCWAFAGDCDPVQLRSNTCEVEWPPRTGKRMVIPEVDRGGWFTLEEAAERILAGLLPLLERLREVPAVAG